MPALANIICRFSLRLTLRSRAWQIVKCEARLISDSYGYCFHYYVAALFSEHSYTMSNIFVIDMCQLNYHLRLQAQYYYLLLVVLVVSSTAKIQNLIRGFAECDVEAS
jgi:hypothetical protein